jgi:hypothetical protein
MEISHLPTTVDTTLYKYNHYDNQIWTIIKNELDWIDAGEDAMIVYVPQLVNLIEDRYQLMLNKIAALGSGFLHKDVNSIYFLYMMCMDMERLQYVKLTLSKQKKFNRMMTMDDEKVLKFDFKILTITFRLSDFFSIEEIRTLNKALIDAKILEEGVPYASHRLGNLLNKLDDMLSDMLTDDSTGTGDLLAGMLDILDPKLENDNPITLLVTDY